VIASCGMRSSATAHARRLQRTKTSRRQAVRGECRLSRKAALSGAPAALLLAGESSSADGGRNSCRFACKAAVAPFRASLLVAGGSGTGRAPRPRSSLHGKQQSRRPVGSLPVPGGRRSARANRGVTVVSMLTRSAHIGTVAHGMSERGLGATLLAVLILAASCGGDGAPRVTLTDKSCAYSGARTHEPGPFEIEAENTTSHGASFAVFELAPGFSIKDVRGFFRRVIVAHDRGEQEVKRPTQDDLTRDASWSHADPRATVLLPVNASAGRFVIVCMENPSADTRPSSQDVWPDPAAIYVPTQLEIRR
jgi:hypothetical protein